MQGDQDAKAMLNGWLGMQEKMVQSWWEAFAQPPQNGHAAASPTAAWNPWLAQGAQQWQSLYGDPWMALTQGMMNGVTKQAMTQFLSGQAQTQQLMQMVTEAWQSMLAKGMTPTEWQAALTTYVDQLRQQMSTAMNGAKLVENSAELWRLYYDEAQKFTQPWLSATWQLPNFMGKMGGPDQAAATNEFMQLFQAAFEQTWGRALMAPTMGLAREFNEKVNKGFALWLENQQFMLAYQLLVGEAWVDAFQALMQKLVGMAQKGETLVDQRHLLRIWVEVADEIFIALFHSDAYAKVQSAYVNSNMALRRQQRELLEVWLRNNDMPTRTDVEAAHQELYQLRKEVKALKKNLTARTEQPAARPVAKAKTAPRPASKSRVNTSGKAAAKTADTPPIQATIESERKPADADQQAQEGEA